VIRVPEQQESLKLTAGGRTLNTTPKGRKQETTQRLSAQPPFEPVNGILEINSNSTFMFRLVHIDASLVSHWKMPVVTQKQGGRSLSGDVDECYSHTSRD